MIPENPLDPLLVALFLQIGQERADRFSAAGMDAPSGYFRQWRKNKKSLGHTGVGNGQMLVIKDQGIVEQKIEIKGPVLVAKRAQGAEPAMLSLDCVQQAQKGVRCEPCPHQGCGIDKPVTAVHADRLVAIGRGEG